MGWFGGAGRGKENEGPPQAPALLGAGAGGAGAPHRGGLKPRRGGGPGAGAGGAGESLPAAPGRASALGGGAGWTSPLGRGSTARPSGAVRSDSGGPKRNTRRAARARASVVALVNQAVNRFNRAFNRDALTPETIASYVKQAEEAMRARDLGRGGQRQAGGGRPGKGPSSRGGGEAGGAECHPPPAEEKAAAGRKPARPFDGPRKVLTVLTDGIGGGFENLSMTIRGLGEQGWTVKYLKAPTEGPDAEFERLLGRPGAVVCNFNPAHVPAYCDLLFELRREGVLLMQAPSAGLWVDLERYPPARDWPQKLLAPATTGMREDAATEEDGFREVTVLVTGGSDSYCEREVIKSVVVPALRREFRGRRVRILHADLREENPNLTASSLIQAVQGMAGDKTATIHVHVGTRALERFHNEKQPLPAWLASLPNSQRRPYEWLKVGYVEYTRQELELLQFTGLHSEYDAEAALAHLYGGDSGGGGGEETHRPPRAGSNNSNLPAPRPLLVYLRDEHFYGGLPEDALPRFVSPAPEARERLAALYLALYGLPLCQVRRYPCQYFEGPLPHPGTQNYDCVRGLERFGDLVRADISAQLQVEFPAAEEDVITEAECQPEFTMREERAFHYVRSQYEKTLLRCVKLGKPKVLLAMGQEGSGVSTVLARCAREIRRSYVRQRGKRDEIVVVSYFACVTDLSRSVTELLRNVCQSLCHQCRVKMHIPSNYNELRAAFLRLLLLVVEDSPLGSRRVAIFIDGVTELHNPLGLHWLPLEHEIPDGVQLVLGASYFGKLEGDEDTGVRATAVLAGGAEGDELDQEAASRSRKELDVLQATYAQPFASALRFTNLQHQERRGFFLKRLAAGHAGVEEELLYELLGKADMGSTHYAACLGASVVEMGCMLDSDTIRHLPANRNAALDLLLDEADERFGVGVMKDLLPPLALCQHGLPLIALQHFVGSSVAEQDLGHWTAYVFPVVLRKLSLFIRGPVRGLYALANDGARRAVRRHYIHLQGYDPIGEQEVFMQLGRYFGQFVGPEAGVSFLANMDVMELCQQPRVGFEAPAGETEDAEVATIYEHAVRALFGYFRDAQDWANAVAMLIDLTYVQAKVNLGLVEDLLQEYDSILIEEHAGLGMDVLLRSGSGGAQPAWASSPFEGFRQWLEAEPDAEDITNSLVEMRMFLQSQKSGISLRPNLTVQLAANMPESTYPCQLVQPLLATTEPEEEYLNPEVKIRYVLQWVNKPEIMDRCVMLMRHPQGVLGIGLSGHGHIATCCEDSNAYIWNAQTGSLVLTVNGHSHPVRDCAMYADSRQGYRLVTVSSDKTAKVWNLSRGGALMATLRAHSDSVSAVQYAPSGEYFVTASADLSVRFWCPHEFKELHCLRGVHTDSILGLAVSNDSKTIASCGWDSQVRLIEYNGGEARPEFLKTLKRHTACVPSCAFSPDGKLFASVSHDKTAVLWDMSTHRAVGSLGGHYAPLNSVAFAPGSRLIATCSKDCNVRVFDTESLRCIVTLFGHRTFVTGVAFSETGEHLASVSEDGSVRLWGRTGGSQNSVNISEVWENLSSTQEAQAAEIVAGLSEGAEAVAATATEGRRVPETAQPTSGASGHVPSRITCICRASEGARFVTGSEDRSIKTWDAGQGEELLQLHGHKKAVRACAGATEQGQCKVLSASDDGNLVLWNIETGEDDAMLVGHSGPVYCCDWNRSCGVAASAGKDRSLRLWDMRDTDSGVVSCLNALEGHAERVFDVTFSTVQEHVLASASRDQTVRLWDVDRQAETLRLGQHADEVYTCAFSQDGGTVAAGGAGRLFQIVDIRSGASTFEVVTEEPLLASAFSDMWTWWAAYCSGSSSVVVDLRVRREVARFDCYDGECTALAFCGTKLVCGDSLGRMYVLQINRSNFATPPSPEHQGRARAF